MTRAEACDLIASEAERHGRLTARAIEAMVRTRLRTEDALRARDRGLARWKPVLLGDVGGWLDGARP